jgi:hypothetical protein
MKETPPTTAYEVKEVIRGMRCDKDPGTDHLQAESFKYRGNEFTKITEILTKEGHQHGRKGLSARCVGKDRKWTVQSLCDDFISYSL